MDSAAVRDVRAMIEAQVFAQSIREMSEASPLGDYEAEAFAQLLAARLTEGRDAG